MIYLFSTQTSFARESSRSATPNKKILRCAIYATEINKRNSNVPKMCQFNQNFPISDDFFIQKGNGVIRRRALPRRDEMTGNSEYLDQSMWAATGLDCEFDNDRPTHDFSEGSFNLAVKSDVTRPFCRRKQFLTKHGEEPDDEGVSHWQQFCLLPIPARHCPGCSRSMD